MKSKDFQPIVNAILSYSNYKHAPFEKKISGSGYGAAPQQVLLGLRHRDEQVDDEPLERKTPLVIGTATHFLMEFADIDTFFIEAGLPYRVFNREQSFHYKTGINDWVLTGTADLILINIETGKLIICDMKTMRTSVGKNFNEYNNQLSIYAYTAGKYYNMEFEDKGLIVYYDKTSMKFGLKLIELKKNFDPLPYVQSIADAEHLSDDELPRCTPKQTNFGRHCSTYCGVSKFCRQLIPFTNTSFTAT